MYKHFIWDFDGTLFDTYPHMTRSFQMALKDFSIDESFADILVYMKISVTEAINHYKGKYDIDGNELGYRYREHETKGDKSLVQPYPHVGEVCQKVSEIGAYNYLYTHRNTGARNYLKQFDLESYFSDFITSEDDFPSKPAPDAILHLIDKHKMEKGDVLMIGDRDIDILAGYNAGVEGCLFDPGSFYHKFEVRYRVHTMEEFKTTLLKNSPVSKNIISIATK